MPESWAGCRNIDEEIDLDEINRILGAEKEEQRDGDAESGDGKWEIKSSIQLIIFILTKF